MPIQARMIAAGSDYAGAPLLRREFRLDKDSRRVTQARLMLTALGVVEAWINGRPVSEDLLVPGWTSYEWRLRYADYDVTELVDGPSLVLGVSLGKGWHGGRLGWAPEGSWYGDDIAVLAQLEVTYDDGTQELFVTDESWRSGPSSILANDLYDGQTIDARLRDERWKHPGFDEASWVGVRVLDFDTQKLVPYFGPHVRRWATLTPRSVTRSPSGRTLVDFGQNLVGWVKFTATGAPGTEITIRHAEVLENGELGTEPLRSAEATDRYILSGGRDEFEPTFTFHGFRYAEVSGWPGELRTDDLVAVAVGSELKRIGHFTTSNPLLNQLHENVVWGLRGNFLSVPSDCPQRDERLGWTGDLSVFAPAAAFLFDVKEFLSDWLIDLALEQEHRDGIAGWVVPDVMKYLPADSVFGVSDSTAIWGDAAVWVPWTLYQAYGDVAVLQRQYESMCSHVRRVERLLSPTGVWDGNFQFGDWLDPDAPPDEPARAKADPGVVATACAYRSATIVAQTAALLGRGPDHAEFGALAARLRRAFGDVYVHDGVVTSDCSTVYALAIVFGLLSPEDEVSAGGRLAELARAADYRVTTGFAGTPFITEALSRTGHLAIAYRLLLETGCPSWLYPVTMGATTIWERWDSLLPDGSINPSGMTSFNHYALGAVADWMHRVIGGVSPLAPGYSRVLVAPQPGGELTEARTALDTPHGRVEVRWTLAGTTLRVAAELPDGVDGVLRLPGRPDRELCPGLTIETCAFLDG